MGCNCLKNPRYKSVESFYNNGVQAISSAAAAVTLLGTVVTDTGVSVSVNSNSIEIEANGTYDISAGVEITATTAGEVTIQLYQDGTALPETLRTETVAVGSNQIDTRAVRYFKGSCMDSPTIQLMVTGDGTAAGSVTMAYGSIVKLAGSAGRW